MVQLGKQINSKNSDGGCGSLDDSDDKELAVWSSWFLFRRDYETESGDKHMTRMGPKGWCKPSCIPITVILILIVLVVLVPLMEQKEAEVKLVEPPCCSQSCKFSLVESIPEGLIYSNTSVMFPSTYDVWYDLIKMAQYSIEIGSFYWSLRSADVTPGDPSSRKGDEIFQALLRAGTEKKVNIRIAQNAPLKSQSSDDIAILVNNSAAEVRTLDFKRLLGSGVLHSKFWIIDQEHFYIGSANMDWRALTQVKELGLVAYNCGTLATDLAKIFEVLWFLGKPDSKIPPKWPNSLSTKFNKDTPFNTLINWTSEADVYIASSPPPFSPKGRTDDIDAILDIISNANKFIYISVMNYLPLILYTPKPSPRFWPIIDNALRTAAVDRKIEVRLLISRWKNSRKSERYFLKSLKDINGSYANVSVDAKWFRVPSTPEEEQIPYARVNHNKYMVTDNTAYIGTSNWSGDYFTKTAGVGLVVRTIKNKTATLPNTLRDQLQQVFERDWYSTHTAPVY